MRPDKATRQREAELAQLRVVLEGGLAIHWPSLDQVLRGGGMPPRDVESEDPVAAIALEMS